MVSTVSAVQGAPVLSFAEVPFIPPFYRKRRFHTIVAATIP